MRLIRLLSWPYLRRHLSRWLLTLAGIVLGVAVFVAMHTANRSMFRAFDETVDRIAGATQLQVSAGEFGFDESTLERVQAIPEVGIAVPVIEATVEIAGSKQGGILVLGVDMTGDRSLRDYDLNDADEAIIDDPLIFLAQPDSLMVTKEFAERNSLGINAKLTLLTVEGEKRFTVRGIMNPGGLSAALGGNLAVMDIYAAQQLLGRGRRIDRIDLRTRDGVSLDDCRAAVKQVLGPGFDVEPPAARGKYFESLLQNYSRSISISSLFALIVGMFIIYNSFAIAVMQRRAEIGILRALGATRGEVQRLFVLESVIAGVIGSALGVVAGLAGAAAVARYTSFVVEQAGGGTQRITELNVDPSLVGVALVAGIAASILAAWIPSREASRVDPVKALQKGKRQILSVGENRRRRRLAILFAMVSAVSLFFSNSKLLFYGGYVLTILAALLLAPTLTLWLSKALRPLLKWTVSAEGTLAADSLIQAPRRTSATVAALMLSLAMATGFAGFTRSFYLSVGEWIDDVINPDFFIAPSTNLTERTKTFPNELAAVIERLPGVAQVQLVRNARATFREIPVLIVSLDIEKVGKTTRRSVLAGSLEQMNRLTAEGKGTIVSSSFATPHKLRLGDVIELPTPSGAVPLEVAGIVRDYSDLQGTLFIDQSVYDKWWKDESSNIARVYVAHGEDAAEVRQRIVSALTGYGRLFVLSNREVRNWIMQILDQWFALTYSQIAVAILVAVLGIVNTLTVSITDRRRELGVMQAVGAFRNQVRRTIWLEALSIAVIGLTLGIGLGALNLYYTLGMVKRDLGGMDLNYVFPISVVLLTIPTILAAAFAASIGPVEAAVRCSIVDALEYE